MIHKNYTTAQEQFPEFFGSITMLYIDVKVNNWPIQAFVDSGA
jgi:DNA damage-inducible protein 1